MQLRDPKWDGPPASRPQPCPWPPPNRVQRAPEGCWGLTVRHEPQSRGLMVFAMPEAAKENAQRKAVRLAPHWVLVAS